MVETLQNISKHSYQKNGLREGIFTLSRHNENYILSTGNFIENHKIENFRKYLEELSRMTLENLNLYYKKILRNGNDFEDNNGGLGFIDIMRECYGKVDYEFYEIDNEISFFSLTLEI